MRLRLKKEKHLINPLVAFALSYVIWGVTTPTVKIGLQTIPPTIFAAIKFIVAALIILPWLIKHWQPVNSKIKFRILIATVIGYVVNLLLWYEGIKKTTGSTASLIATFGPVILFMLSIEVLKEKFNSKILFGLIISALGTILIVIAPQLAGGLVGVSLAGNILIFLAVVADVSGTILIKPSLKYIKPEQLTTIRIVVAAIFFAVIALKDIPGFDFSNISLNGYMAALYGAIFSVIIGLSLYHYGLSRMTVEKGTVIHYLEPIFGIVASVIILGEQLSNTFLLGAALIFGGIFVAEARLHVSWLHLRHHRH